MPRARSLKLVSDGRFRLGVVVVAGYETAQVVAGEGPVERADVAVLTRALGPERAATQKRLSLTA